MNKSIILAALALTLTARSSPAAAAAREQAPQRTPAPGPAAAAGTLVVDDDGGAAQIVPRLPQGSPGSPVGAAAGEVSFHGGAVIHRGEVRAIFLGRSWRQEANRRREGRASAELVGRWEAPSLAELARSGVETRELSVQPQEDLLDPLSGREISDLEIQARLDEALRGGAGDPSGTVYVIFLAPGLRSTLGTSSSERDYAAYHNHFHAAAGAVHYTVVPYENDLVRWLANARQGLLQMLINPEGNGWF